MKNYTIITKSEHTSGFTIQLQEYDDKGNPAPEREIISVQTKDKSYADTFVIGEVFTLKKVK